ncbi:putative ribonuclease H-like domain-containing protein [Tanacetum coccineum]|uniref:Ribonuclease H-like domain-containing protein n=1 Tax=Tanacetum coccineum TaxID=301880 RepID=A0ABQ5GVT3_9ASTR
MVMCLSNNNTSTSNEAVNAAHGVTTATTQVNIAYSINIDNLSDAVICSFFASQPDSPQLAHEDLTLLLITLEETIAGFDNVQSGVLQYKRRNCDGLGGYELELITGRRKRPKFLHSWLLLIFNVMNQIDGDSCFGGNPKEGKSQEKGPRVKTEAINTACYVQNRMLVVKPHNKTPYELFHGRILTLSFMRPFGCHVTILNTIDHFGKFDGNADEGFFVRYFLNSKSFKVFNSRTSIVEEKLHIRFSESTPNVAGSGPDWLFDIDALTRTMNYEPIVTDYILLPLWTADPPFSQDPKSSHDDGSKPSSDDGKKVDEDPRKDSEYKDQEKEDNVNSTNNVNAASTNEVNVVGAKTSIELPFDPNMPALEDISIFDFTRDDEDDDVEADMNNLDTTIQVSPIPTTRIHKDHPLDQVIGDLQSATQTRRMSKNLEEHGFVSTIQQRTNHKDLQNCLFACFLSQEEPKKTINRQGRELSQEINNHSVPTIISQIPGPSRKRSRSPFMPFYPDATTFSDGKPTSETSELNPKDVTARLEDIEVEIDTLHADTEDKELLISELQDSLAAEENEFALLQIRVADAEDRRAGDHDQIQTILAHLGL